MPLSYVTLRQIAFFNLEGRLQFGQVPLVEYEGLDLVQSSATVRFFAKKANLCGDNLIDQTKLV